MSPGRRLWLLAPAAGTVAAPPPRRRPRPATIAAALTGAMLVLCAAAFSIRQTGFLPVDHGWSLYAAWAIRRGGLPYIDFQWIYGPLWPYAAALGMTLFGETMWAANLTTLLLGAAGGMAALRAARGMVGPWAAVVVAVVTFWQGLPVSNYMYTGTGGIVALSAWCAWRFALASDGRSRAWWGWAAAWALALLSAYKLNLGIAMMGAISAGLLLMAGSREGLRAAAHDLRWLVSRWGLLVVAAYGAHLISVPWDRLPWCFPWRAVVLCTWLPGPPWIDATFMPLIFWEAVVCTGGTGWREFLEFCVRRYDQVWATLYVVALVVGTAHLALTWRRRARRGLVLWWCAHLGAGHEYLIREASYLLPYFASATTAILLIAAMRGAAARVSAAWRLRVRGMAAARGWLAAAAAFAALMVWNYFRGEGVPVEHPRGGVNVQLGARVRTVVAVSRFVEEHTRPGEPVAAFAHDPIFNFLARRPAALWHISLVKRMAGDEREEPEILEGLRRIRCLLWTEGVEVDPFIGRIGVTHYKRVGEYVAREFRPIAEFGLPERVPYRVRVLWRRGAPPFYPR